MDTILRHALLVSCAAIGVAHLLLCLYGHPEVAWGIDILFHLLTSERDL